MVTPEASGNQTADLQEHFKQALNTVPIVAAQSGRIFEAPRNCIIKMRDVNYGSNKRSYYFLHNDSLAPGIVQDAFVHAGQMLGRVGDNAVTSNCNTSPSSTASMHLHFELHREPATSYPAGSQTVRDPYESLRQSAARPGLFANGSVDWPITIKWRELADAYAQSWGWGGAQAIIGYPVGFNLGPNWSYYIDAANVYTTNSPATGLPGNYQYLGNGDGSWDSHRGTDPANGGAAWSGGRIGALAHLQSSSEAFWVHGAFMKVWTSPSYIYLGFPISQFFYQTVPGWGTFLRQNFEGGCVLADQATGGTSEWPTGQGWCGL